MVWHFFRQLTHSVTSTKRSFGYSTLRPRPVAFKAAIARNLEEKIWPLIAEGRIKPVIHQTFPLAEAAEAHRLMESSAPIGKIMLVP